MIKIYARVNDAENLTLAIRAVKWLLNKPKTQKDAIVAYGGEDGVHKFHFYVKRVRSGISVSQC